MLERVKKLILESEGQIEVFDLDLDPSIKIHKDILDFMKIDPTIYDGGIGFRFFRMGAYRKFFFEDNKIKAEIPEGEGFLTSENKHRAAEVSRNLSKMHREKVSSLKEKKYIMIEVFMMNIPLRNYIDFVNPFSEYYNPDPDFRYSIRDNTIKLLPIYLSEGRNNALPVLQELADFIHAITPKFGAFYLKDIPGKYAKNPDLFYALNHLGAFPEDLYSILEQNYK